MAELSPLAKLHAVSVRVAGRLSGWRDADIMELGAAIADVEPYSGSDLGVDAMLACAHWHHARRDAQTGRLLQIACGVYSTLKIENQPAAVRADLK